MSVGNGTDKGNTTLLYYGALATVTWEKIGATSSQRDANTGIGRNMFLQISKKLFTYNAPRDLHEQIKQYRELYSILKIFDLYKWKANHGGQSAFKLIESSKY